MLSPLKGRFSGRDVVRLVFLRMSGPYISKDLYQFNELPHGDAAVAGILEAGWKPSLIQLN